MSSIIVPGSPVVLYSNGIPISPADLDFGNTVTQQQLNALSSFSQMVNAIPSPGGVWVPTGSQTWSIYNLVLSMAEFARQTETLRAPASVSALAVPSVQRLTTRLAAVAGTAKTVRVPAPAAVLMDHAIDQLSALQRSVSSALRTAGFTLPESAVPAASPAAPAAPRAPSQQLNGAQATGLSSMFLQLKAQFSIDATTDTHGNVFYPTYLFPADFYQPQYDASWQAFEITPGQNTPWAPVNTGAKISGQIMSVQLQRAWWSPWVFSSRGWRFDPAAGMGDLSDGGSPPQGLMPLYASVMIVARNIQVAAPNGLAASHPSPAAAFALTGAVAEGSTASSAAGAAQASDPAGMVIIGFGCTPLAKSPNPDPGLTW